MGELQTLDGPLHGAVSFDTAVKMRRVASDSDIDELGHVNNAVYLVWAQDIAVAHWRVLATPSMLNDYVWVALRHEIDYRDQIFAGDDVELRTWLGRASGARFERHIDIRKAGAPKFAALVRTDWCLIDENSRKPRRIDREIIDLFGVPGI